MRSLPPIFLSKTPDNRFPGYSVRILAGSNSLHPACDLAFAGELPGAFSTQNSRHPRGARAHERNKRARDPRKVVSKKIELAGETRPAFLAGSGGSASKQAEPAVSPRRDQ